MKITAITKFKHGALLEAIRKLGWNQQELSRQLKTHPTTIGSIINLKRRPSVREVNAIQRVLGDHGVYIDVEKEWPETFRGLPTRITIEQTKDVTALELEAAQTYYGQLDSSDNSEIQDAVIAALPALDDRLRMVVEARFGLAGGGPLSLEEVGDKFNVTGERVRGLQNQALRQLKRAAMKIVESEDGTASPLAEKKS